MRRPVGPDLWWTATGMAVGFGIVAILTIGAIFLVIGIGLIVAGVAVDRLRNRSAYLLLVGAAAVPLTLAWLNRDGPGTVCHTSGETTTCSEQWTPWPFLGAGVVLVAVGWWLATRPQAVRRAA